MTYATSTGPDITESIPTQLSRAVQSSQAYTATGVRYDITLGGIGFMLSASDQRPYIRQTAPIQKQQIDTSHEAGEQTLDGSWIRSQTSWHHGAGVKFYEPGSDPVTVYRYEESQGVDVFTRGSVTLLKKCTVVGAVSGSQIAYVTGAVVGGADVSFSNENGVIKRRDNAGASLASYTGTFSTPLTPVAVGGAKVYIGHTFGIESANATGSTFAVLYTQALGNTATPYWVKSRLIATRGTSIYELAPDGSSGVTPGNLDTVTALYTHPDTGWTWSGVAESPTAILAAGYSNGRGAIYRFELVDAASGGVPKLSQAYQIAEFPVGEQVLALHVHLGRYVGIGTTQGMRIGILDANSNLQYGPLLVKNTAVRSITSAGHSMYGAVQSAQPDGLSGAVVVDLSEEINNTTGLYYGVNTLLFPYSWHARTGTAGRVDQISMLGASGRVLMGVFGEGIYEQSATLYEASGWIRSGRIRYGTVEVKKFRSVDMGATITDGAVGLYVVGADGTETYVRNLTASAPDGRGILLGSAAVGNYEHLRFRVSLTASGSGTVTPSLDSIQVRALPAPARQEMIQYPLMCFDHEQSPNGTKYGAEGFAFSRFSALKQIERTMAVVSVTDTSTKETFDAQVENVEFRQLGPRASNGRANFGGYLAATVRKLA